MAKNYRENYEYKNKNEPSNVKDRVSFRSRSNVRFFMTKAQKSKIAPKQDVNSFSFRSIGSSITTNFIK